MLRHNRVVVFALKTPLSTPLVKINFLQCIARETTVVKTAVTVYLGRRVIFKYRLYVDFDVRIFEYFLIFQQKSQKSMIGPHDFQQKAILFTFENIEKWKKKK